MGRLANERALTQVLLLFVGIALFVVTLGHGGSAMGAAQSPMFFPRIILGMWIFFASLALFQDLTKPQDTARIGLLLAAVSYVVVAVIYVNLVTRIGFGLSSVPFAAASLWIFGVRNVPVVLAYAVVVPGALVLLFNHILKMPLPTSPFTYLF